MLKEKHAFYEETFGTKSGKLVLEDLEKDAYINRSTISDGGNIDPHQIAFREGIRSIVLKIQNYIAYDVDQYKPVLK